MAYIQRNIRGRGKVRNTDYRYVPNVGLIVNHFTRRRCFVKEFFAVP